MCINDVTVDTCMINVYKYAYTVNVDFFYRSQYVSLSAWYENKQDFLYIYDSQITLDKEDK
jgi:hypothetical protein